ncbi:MAG: ferrochelatase [Acidobacteria bacterium]|nr:ferrochelatase [Acidobacteriota bacterium]
MANSKNCIWLLGEGDPRNESEILPFVAEWYGDYLKSIYPKWLADMGASLLSKTKVKKITALYSLIKKYGIIWSETQKLAEKIEDSFINETKVFVGMRYFSNELRETAKEIVRHEFEKILLFPLFPQESDFFSSPCMTEAEKYLRYEGFKGRICFLRRFFDEPYFIDLVSDLIEEKKSRSKTSPKVVLAGNPIPKKISGRDSYLAYLKETAKLIGEKIKVPISMVRPNKDAWQEGILAYFPDNFSSSHLEPTVEEVIEEWGQGGCNSIIVAQISSIVESVNTESYLDVICRKKAESFQMEFLRVEAVSSHQSFLKFASAISEKFFND